MIIVLSLSSSFPKFIFDAHHIGDVVFFFGEGGEVVCIYMMVLNSALVVVLF